MPREFHPLGAGTTNDVTVRYGAFVFDPALTLTEDFEVRPQPDASGRTNKYSVFALTLRTWVLGSPTDQTVKDAVATLTQPADQLQVHGTGWGDLDINLGGAGRRDVLWGPTPKVLRLRPSGRGKRGVWITWAVQWCVPTCADARFSGLMELAYKVAYAVDRYGLTRRSVSGFLRVAGTRRAAGDRSLPDTADDYRGLLTPPMIPGFDRTPGEWTLSEDKLRVDLAGLTDEQMGRNIPPAGCVTAKLTPSFESIPSKYYLWVGTLAGTYELARNADPSVAVKAFLAEVGRRRDSARLIPPAVGPDGSPAAGGRVAVIPVQFAVEEPDAYARVPVVKCRFVYMINGADFAGILGGSGVFRPIAGSNWQLWSASLAQVLGPYGAAGLRFRATDEAVVDLCGRDQPRKLTSAPRGQTERQLDGVVGSFAPPDPDSSWLDYVLGIRTEGDQGTVVTKTLSDKPVEADDEKTLDTAPDPFAGTMPRPTQPNVWNHTTKPAAEGDETRADQVRSPLVYLYLTGWALRVGYPIPCPALTDVGDVKATPCDRTDRGEGYWTAPVGTIAGWPVYYAAWVKRYALTDLPKDGRLPIPTNPQDGAKSKYPKRPRPTGRFVVAPTGQFTFIGPGGSATVGGSVGAGGSFDSPGDGGDGLIPGVPPPDFGSAIPAPPPLSDLGPAAAPGGPGAFGNPPPILFD